MKKKLIIVAIVLFLISWQIIGTALARHNSFSVTWTHKFGTHAAAAATAADSTLTAAEAKYRDTVYTDWYELPQNDRVLFFDIYGGFRDTTVAIRDTLWDNDTVLIRLQTSPNGGITIVNRTDSILKYSPTSVDLDTFIVSSVRLQSDTLTSGGSHIDGWVRFMIITRDSLEANSYSLIGNTYKRDYKIYLKTTQ